MVLRYSEMVLEIFRDGLGDCRWRDSLGDVRRWVRTQRCKEIIGLNFELLYGLRDVRRCLLSVHVH